MGQLTEGETAATCDRWLTRDNLIGRPLLITGQAPYSREEDAPIAIGLDILETYHRRDHQDNLSVTRVSIIKNLLTVLWHN